MGNEAYWELADERPNGFKVTAGSKDNSVARKTRDTVIANGDSKAYVEKRKVLYNDGHTGYRYIVFVDETC